MTLFVYIVIILFVYVTYKSTINGLCMFIAIRALVPEIVRSPIDFLSLNSFIILILLLFTLKRESLIKNITNDSLSRFLLLFIVYSGISLILSNYLSLLGQLKFLIQSILTEYIPIFITITLVRSKATFNIVIKTIVHTALCISIYGIITFVINYNPIVDIDDKIIITGIDAIERRNTSSTFIHTNGFGYYLAMMIPFLLIINKYFNVKYLMFIITLLLINVLLSGKRSPIIIVAYLFIYYLLKYQNKRLLIKYVIYFSPIVLIILFSLLYIPKLEYLRIILFSGLMFWDDSFAHDNGIYGSTMDLRILQCVYPFVEIKDNLLFGHGVGWCSNYLSINEEIHPVLFGFETIFSTVICEYGIVGLVLYIIFFYIQYTYIKGLSIGKFNFSFLFFSSNLLLFVATGVNYLYFYLLELVLLCKYRKIFY